MRRSIVVLSTVSVLIVLVSVHCPGRETKPPAAATTATDAKPEDAAADPSADAQKSGRPMTLHRNDLNWLASNSPLVFVGRLTGKETVEDQRRRMIITRNRFEIERALNAATADKTIVLTTLGGTIGNTTLTVSHMPIFVEGQRYVIFTDPRRTSYDPVTGNQDGVFLIGPDEGIYTYQGIAVAGVAENGILQLGSATLQSTVIEGARMERSTEQMAPPTTEKGVVSAVSAALDTRPPLKLDQFAGLVQRAARPTP